MLPYSHENTMNKYLQTLIASGIVLLGSWSLAFATSTFITQQGGTGTSSPSGILYGDNGATSHINTVSIGSGCTFIGGVLSCTGTGIGIGDPFTHPIFNSSATTSRMLIGATSFPTGSTYNDQLDVSTSTNDFVSVGNWNTSNGTCASAEYDANNNLSTLSTNYASFGITGGNFTGVGCANNPFTAFGANSAYSIVTNGNMNWAMGSTSASAQFRWLTDTNGDGQYTTADTKMILTQAGQLAIGSTTPDAPLTITNNLTSFATPPSGTTIHFVQSGTNARVVGDTYQSAQTGTNYQGRHARGTSALPTAVIADDSLVLIGGAGYGTTKFTDASVGAFVVRASGTFTDTSAPTYLTMVTTPINSIIPIERLRVDASGNVGVATTTPFGQLAVSLIGGNVPPGNNAFFISSSTSNSTTTIFSVSNTGLASSSALTVSGNTTLKSSLTGLAYTTAGLVSSIANGTIGSTGVLGISGGVPAFVATSTLYGPGTGGQVLMYSNATNGLVFAATSTASGSAFAYPFTNPSEYSTTTFATTTPFWAQEGIFASTTNSVFQGLTIDNALAGDASTQFGATNHEWAIGAKSSDFTFRISSSTTLGTSDALTIDKNLLVSIPTSLKVASLAGLIGGNAGVFYAISTSSPLNTSITGNAATVTTNANLSGVVTSSGNTTSYGSQSAGVLGNATTGNTAPMATSTLYGVPIAGTIHAFLNGAMTWISTTTLNIGGNAATVTTNANLSGAVTSSGSNVTAFGSQSAGVLGTAATGIPSMLATSTLFGGTATFGVGKVGVASTTPNFTLSVGTTGSDFYVDSTGKIVGRDVANNWNGRITPTRAFGLSTATTTTWTASTTGSAYTPFMVMPFVGTLRQARCGVDSFLGVNIQIDNVSLTPSYFVASSTEGVIIFTGNNTFTIGQRISANFGTTTTATATSTSCTLEITETP